jgi:hypothetical protein
MAGKAQKSHGARSELYGGCSNEVPPIHFFEVEHRIQFRSPPFQYKRYYFVSFQENLYKQHASGDLSNLVKCKVPVLFLTEHHAMTAYWESGGIAARILWPQHWK